MTLVAGSGILVEGDRQLAGAVPGPGPADLLPPGPGTERGQGMEYGNHPVLRGAEIPGSDTADRGVRGGRRPSTDGRRLHPGPGAEAGHVLPQQDPNRPADRALHLQPSTVNQCESNDDVVLKNYFCTRSDDFLFTLV